MTIPKQKFEELLIQSLIQEKANTAQDLAKTKRKIAKKFGLNLFPSNVDLLKIYHRLVKNKSIKESKATEQLLITRPIRSLSGIVNVSVLTKPWPCPGKCIFCPTAKGFPKSYLAGEPAADRAKFLNYNPYLQVAKRLEALTAQGHLTDKIELRIVGGTWSSYPKQYQTWFIKRCFQAANEFETKSTSQKQTLEKTQTENETAKHRIVGLSVETRPDFITLPEIKRLRSLAVTLIELGAQTVFDEIHQKSQTKTTALKIAQATELLKNAGFKILYQIMPNLPGATPAKDLKLFKILFNDSRFKPDWLKIYPCLICPDTKLLKLWQKGKYKPYSEKTLLNLLIEIKKNLPYWVRITRIFRDIPSQSIVAGCKVSNIRELVQEEMKKQGLKCPCIRCRETKSRYDAKEKAYLFREDYDASEGKEIFLSWENKNRSKLYSLLRLRIPSKSVLPILRNAALIREIQTFGSQLPLEAGRGPSSTSSPQHKGMGKKLVKQAEKIAKQEFGFAKMAVISGIGARKYYRKLGYRLQGTYMVKTL